MKRVRSKINDREYYYGDGLPNQIDGLPCFSMKEIMAMKGTPYSAAELNAIFDTKLEMGATVEPIESDYTPHEDVGYMPPITPPQEIKKTIIKSRADTTAAWARRIKETIAATPTRGVDENVLAETIENVQYTLLNEDGSQK